MLHNTGLMVWLPWQYTEFQTSPILKAFGHLWRSRVLGNEVWIEVNPFPLLVLIDILSFICRSSGPSEVAGGLLFDFEPGVDVFGKESYLTSFWREVVDFVDLDEGVPKFHGFLDFGGAPFSSERALLEGVVTETRFF